MLVTFSSKVDADVLMMANHALLVLRATGKDVGERVPERGVFTAQQLQDAIAELEQAIASEDVPSVEHDDDDADGKPKRPDIVILAQRAYPLLAMMRKARDAGASVMWETSASW
jgi:hypothetical protein